MPAQKLKFSVSIDASPGFNHWPRAKFEQSKFEQNFELLLEKQIALTISPVISVISVFDLPNFLSWLDRHNLVSPNWIRLRNPECLDPAYIPNLWRQKIFESIKDTNSSQILEEILIAPAVDNKLRLIEQHNYLTQYFQRNNLDPLDCHNQLFQEYWSWLTKNYKI